MSAITKLRAERGQMSAMDRRIADYILANARLLRDYSSQQLADALKVSQSSIVKFAQRLGFKGYPDLKLSITEAVAVASAEEGGRPASPVTGDPDAARSDALWQSKSAAERETQSVNPPQAVANAARWITEADTLFVAGSGIDAGAAHSFAGRISLMGRRCIAHVQPHDLTAGLAAATPQDVLLIVCGHDGQRDDAGHDGYGHRGGHHEWQQACHDMRAVGGRIVVITRRGRDAVVPIADACLLVSAHDPQPHIEELIYEAAMRHLLDDLFLRIVALRPEAVAAFAANHARARAARGDVLQLPSLSGNVEAAPGVAK
ncbi:MAG: MurR/RpiR family transcriptional regulator [Pirellulales bacterium]